MIEIIKGKKKWDTILKNILDHDFYHTFHYHQLSKNDDEEPILIVYTEGKEIIALPLLLRKINGTPYMDATSAYGYPGPIAHNISENYDNTNFKKELESLFIENNIISVFSRLNPFLLFQEVILKNLGEISSPGKIINIDLTKSLDAQKNEYQRRLRTYINKSKKMCSVRKTGSKKDISLFIDMYYENMKRVGASKKYFFKKKYFYDFFNSSDFKTELLLAIHNKTNEIIAGAMFVKKNNIVQYHLSGAKEKHLDLNPIKFLIDEMRVSATAEKYDYFNLGGGLGSKEDSLFRFKSNFSKDLKKFKLWKYIVSQKIYNDLVEQKMKENNIIDREQYADYFPGYRIGV